MAKNKKLSEDEGIQNAMNQKAQNQIGSNQDSNSNVKGSIFDSQRHSKSTNSTGMNL